MSQHAKFVDKHSTGLTCSPHGDWLIFKCLEYVTMHVQVVCARNFSTDTACWILRNTAIAIIVYYMILLHNAGFFNSTSHNLTNCWLLRKYDTPHLHSMFKHIFYSVNEKFRTVSIQSWLSTIDNLLFKYKFSKQLMKCSSNNHGHQLILCRHAKFCKMERHQ